MSTNKISIIKKFKLELGQVFISKIGTIMKNIITLL